MKPQRPTSVLILAILNFVFGGIGLLMYGCCGSVSVAVILGMGGQSDFGPFAELTELFDELQQIGGPAVTVFLVLQPLGSLLFCSLLIASGFGLLQLRSWGWWTAAAYAVYCTFSALARAVFQIVLVNPVTGRMNDAMAGGHGADNPFADPILLNVISVGEALMYLAFAFLILVILFLPGVRAAIASQGTIRSAHNDEGD